MFESIRKERTLVDILRCLLLPVVVALAMDIPMEIDLYTLRLNDSAAMSFIWLYFHAVIAGALSFGGPQHPWGAWPSFLTKDENSWLMTVVNVAFYVLLTVWCRYAITDGFTVGFDAADFRRYRPLKVGCVLLILGCLGLGGVALYDRFPPDEETGFVFYALTYAGAVLALVSVIVVVGRKVRLNRFLGSAA